MAYAAITVEGGLFPPDLLDSIAAGEAPGQQAREFGVEGRLGDEIQAAFSDIRAYWDAFERRLANAPADASRTTLTREYWLIPLLERLGYSLAFQRAGAMVGGENFAISHRAGDEPESPPVHIVAFDESLGSRARGRRSPHALVQEYLNRGDALWGLVTNGEQLRLLRDSERLSRPTYLEFDLRGMIEGNLYNEFVLLYRLLHRSRLPRGAGDAAACHLERLYQQGLDEGGRVREGLRDGVEAALEGLGSAFLLHPESAELRRAIAEQRLDADTYYRQLLRLIYRLLFLFVAEERKLVFPPEDVANRDRQEIYSRYYSISRLRDRCERAFAGDGFADVWPGLVETFRLFRDETAAQHLGLTALNGELFGDAACRDLEQAACENSAILRAIFQLSTFRDEKIRRRVTYAALDVEELGSVYESLLDFRPVVDLDDAKPFRLETGSDRKTTGSYYTPPELVRELIESALVPVIE
ncbi:MAG: Eco57I restriction-modification methylase domain-containing protein, partial [Thermomicrobiales bacterium]